MDYNLPIGCPSCVYGCLYWRHSMGPKLIKLNINRMEFSAVSLPPDFENRPTVVVEAGEGRIGMLSLMNENPQSLLYSIWKNESEIADEHPNETTIPLPDDDISDFCLINYAPVEGYVFLTGLCNREGLSQRFVYFSLEIKTMKFEGVSVSNGFGNFIPYFGFPPFMSTRRM